MPHPNLGKKSRGIMQGANILSLICSYCEFIPWASWQSKSYAHRDLLTHLIRGWGWGGTSYFNRLGLMAGISCFYVRDSQQNGSEVGLAIYVECSPAVCPMTISAILWQQKPGCLGLFVCLLIVAVQSSLAPIFIYFIKLIHRFIVKKRKQLEVVYKKIKQ